MLFFHFLCLFYLMVLINSHTLPKNIAHDVTIDDIVDSIHDLEYRREYKPKHDRIYRYYRREETENSAKCKEKEEPKLKRITTKLVPDTKQVTKLVNATTPKSTKRVGFWHKFQFKGNEKKSKALKKENEVFKRKAMPRRRSYRKKQYLQLHADDKYIMNKFDDPAIAFKRRRVPSIDKRKRDVSNVTATTKDISSRASLIFNPFGSKSAPLFKFSTVKAYESLHSTDNITKALTVLTTRIDNLKKENALKIQSSASYPTFTTPSMVKTISVTSPSYARTTQSTTKDADFLGTAQIESLLNAIKLKAVQMIADQSPAITDIITNTVTETTFEVDPILNHIGTPGYALSTFISIDNDTPYSKRAVSVSTAAELKNKDTVVIANTEPMHHISARSINEDVFTIAQTIEDMLQKKLKKVYKKVKGKVYQQMTTIQKETEKAVNKIAKNFKKQSHTKSNLTTPITTPAMKTKFKTKNHKGSTLKQVRRSPKHSKNDNNKVKTSLASTQSTLDDYAMLTLYEQILTKTHEDNLMKMLTTPVMVRKNRDNFRIFKRAPGTLAHVDQKENEQKIYDEVILPDEFSGYKTKITNPYSYSTESGVQDTSYEGLSKKISYNDYVNGYKHYLKFQKEQGNQNFSNLVRYQAHIHHSVDDIGKFILNKIPQLPTNERLKRFFDDDTMEDQDISTKSDDSWFRKHFYLFIDNGPPKKFHTSQTVELKSPITDSGLGSSGTENPVITPRPKNRGLTENFGDNSTANEDSIEDSLEKISKALDLRKSKEFTSVIPEVNNINNEAKMDALNKENSPEYSIFKGLGSIGLVEKIFGKGRRTPKHNGNINKEKTEELSEIDREKRNLKMNVQDFDNLYTSQRNAIRSTIPNVIETRNKNYGYVDVNLIPRPTAIVKLRENKERKGKLKKFFSRFHFRKRKKNREFKKTDRNKREYRVQRFNPLRKLKEMFKMKQEYKPAESVDIPDYEMITSHIDTFKPVKYNKVMSIDEMKAQIPNITEYLSQIHHGEALKSGEKPMSIAPTSTVTKNATPSLSDLVGSLGTSSQKIPKEKPHIKHLDRFIPRPGSNFDITWPDITYDPSTNKFETNYGTKPSLDDIRSEIDSIQKKLSLPDEKMISTISSRTYFLTRNSDNFPARKILVPAHVHVQKIQSLPIISAKADPKDIQIETKLTRVAKFQLPHFSHDHNNLIEKPPVHKYSHRSPHKKMFNNLSSVKRKRRSQNTYVTLGPINSQSYNEYSKIEYRKPYPDYFNDLLMWHGDLLNTDKLTSTQWDNFIKGLKQDTELSTLSIMDMQRELMSMKDNLKIDDSLKNNKPKLKLPMKVKKDKTRSSSKNSQDIIKTVALKDNTLAEGNGVIIQAEAKYFHIMKQPESEPIRYIKAADLLNDLNRINFTTPAIKYNIDDKIHDTKRNGNFWIDNIEPNSENQEQDSSSVLFLDTTFLAYDDGPDYLTERPKHKKMSKNSPTRLQPLKNQGSQKSVTKTNQSPLQYFSTPLPMRVNDFERFLKENQIDVQSVTTPLVGMPQMVLNRAPAKFNAGKKQYKPNASKPKANKNTLVTPSNFVTINPFYYNTIKKTMENDVQDQNTMQDQYNSKYNNIDEKKQKRYSEIRNERFFEPYRKKPKAEKAKKKIKFFDKKTDKLTPTTTPITDFHYTAITPPTVDDNLQKEVELTIINMNDIEQAEDNNQFKSEEKVKTERPERLTTRTNVEPREKVSKTKSTETTSLPLMNKIHNKLLYKHKDKMNEKITKASMTPATVWNNEDNLVTDDFYTTTFHPMINNGFFNSLHARYPPKRVMISSKHYKYDVIYNNEPGRHGKKAYRGHKRGHNRFTFAPTYGDEEFISPGNISDHQLEPRKSIYSYELLGTTMAPNWREKRRLNIFSNIQGKLKTLLRKKTNITSTVSHKTKTPNEEGKNTTATKESTFEEYKGKRDKQNEIKGAGISTNGDGFNVDYDLDIDRIVERATANIGTKKKLVTKTKDTNQKQKNKDSILSYAVIPHLPPTHSKETPTLKDNITSTSCQDFNKQTTSISSITSSTAKNDPLSSVTTLTTLKYKMHHNSTEEVYFEPLLNDNKIYFAPDISTPKPKVIKETLKAKEIEKLQTKSTETKLEKRDIQPAGKFTAKDVAALEVIVDLVKNTVNYQERDDFLEFTQSYYQHRPTIETSTPVPSSTIPSNVIQVHIAIPYNLQVEKKRSLGSFKVRRVFAAKMFSPVDLEYQVQSFEDTKPTSTVTEPQELKAPKMYLLIDANGSLAKGNFTLKPFKGDIDLSKLKVRQVATTKAFATQKAETSSGKSIGRVTLSKDFVGAINRHLVQLYENLTALNESTPNHHVRVRETFTDPKKMAVKPSFRRHINWEVVKKYFGHDRVCNCKCKPNRTMCRACAASDAVITELIFEFENLIKFMNDHCTEIQTFFWMNPSGGKKLRDTVHKVDQTLHAYYKRVKGKCQGRTCKTFSTCIDKRSFVKKKKIPKKYIGEPLIVDLQKVVNDIETTAELGICNTDNVIEEGEILVNTIRKCIRDVSKREQSDKISAATIRTVASKTISTKKHVMQNVYSLDNINVNIICKPVKKVGITSSTERKFTEGPVVSLNYMPSSNPYDYDTEEIQYKKTNGLRNFFANKSFRKYKMNNFFTYYTKDPDTTTRISIFSKRQMANQIESPLLSDTEGIFWNDNWKSNPLLLSNKNYKKNTITEPTTHHSNKDDICKPAESRSNISKVKRSTSKVILTTTEKSYLDKHVFQRNVNTTDYSSFDTLSHNINELFKIFHNLTDLKEIENMSTQSFDHEEKHTRSKPKHTKSYTSTKISKAFKSIKDKLHFKHKSNATKNALSNKNTTPETTPSLKIEENTESHTNISDATLFSKTKTSEVPTILTKTTLKSTTAKITTTSSISLKPTTNQKEESSQKTHENQDSSQSETTKQETTSITRPGEEGDVKSTENSATVNEKRAKGNFLNKLKSASYCFFHSKTKELPQTTAKADSTEEKRKSRSSATKNNNPPNNDDKNGKSSLTTTNDNENSTDIISEATTDNNPTILIMNDYDTEMEPENFNDFNNGSDTELKENFRSLLLSVLNFEANKLSNEWRRLKKAGNQMEYSSYVTGNSKSGISSLYLSTESNLKRSQNAENDYDIMKTLKELELPTPKSLKAEKKKGTGLLQKIANKFELKVVSCNKEKPKVPCTQPQPPQSTSNTTTSQVTTTTTERQTAKLPPNLKEEKQQNEAVLKAELRKLKLSPKYTGEFQHLKVVQHPKITVNIKNNQEAFKSHSDQVCDICATFKHIQEVLKQIPREEFEKFITNMTCDKYKQLPKYFLIDVSHRKRKNNIKSYKERGFTNSVKWDWIRSKRSINYNKNDGSVPDIGNTKISAEESTKLVVDKKYTIQNELIGKEFAVKAASKTKNNDEIARSRRQTDTVNKPSKINKDAQNTHEPTNFVIEGNEYFEALERDKYGIYRSKRKRRKRANDINELKAALKNLPYTSRPNESYAMLGDSVIIQCATGKKNTRDDTNGFRWTTDRKDMLSYDNVVVDGPRLMIREVEPRNLGDYTCHKGNAAQKKVRLTVITLPTFNVVFTPIYAIDGKCTYSDLKAVQSLGPMMSREVCPDDQLCSVRVNAPVCLRDRVSNAAYLRLTAVVSVLPKDVQCGGRCRRDLHDCLALMAGANAPALASVGVIIAYDGINKTLVPSTSTDKKRTIITHTLRIKDSTNYRDYYSHKFSAQSVNVIASCPAGYYLVSEQKICAACPVGSWSKAGDNACAAEEPKPFDKRGSRLRRSYWWWYPGCEWCAAGWAAACACAGVAALLHARGSRAGSRVERGARGTRGSIMDVKTAPAHSPRARPLSPSRVILAKFFRSRSSTKATDSQETKFGLWKEKNLPPPLPPIDFDL